ncbi:hypothetical protein GGR61_003095 [Xanthomonas arboricola]|nr:hypothetical protein [Xanthomonas sp. 3058]
MHADLSPTNRRFPDGDAEVLDVVARRSKWEIP